MARRKRDMRYGAVAAPKPHVELPQGTTLRGVVDIAIGDRLIKGLLDRQAGTRGDGRSKCPFLTVVSYFARPDGFGSLGFTEATPGLRFFRRETTVFRRLGAPPGCRFFSHPSPELRFSNADPCSPGGGPDQRGSSAGAVSEVR
jgi:hypothetical protein